MLEDAAECYEQIGKHEKAAGQFLWNQEIVATTSNVFLEIWKNQGQLQRAAKLYELGLFFQAASECYDADGDFEKAVEVLQRGDQFDDLIIYLGRYASIKFLY
jgi:tetratricopeptide (TPR) repeat protein